MTRDDIIRMAREAGWRESFTPPVALYRFAALVAAAEREACAREAESWTKRNDDAGAFIAKSIRARGENNGRG